MSTRKFLGGSTKLVEALTSALETSLKNLDFDVRCLDWISDNPDFFIGQKNKKVA